MKRTMCGFCVVFHSVSSPVAGEVMRERCARLHRGRDQPLLDDAVANDDIGVLERGIDVAAGNGPVERDVVRRVLVQLRRARP